jgi:hypothetical protein
MDAERVLHGRMNLDEEKRDEFTVLSRDRVEGLIREIFSEVFERYPPALQESP